MLLFYIKNYKIFKIKGILINSHYMLANFWWFVEIMPNLFNGDNSDSEKELKINTDYAKNYNNWRQKEELNKCK